MEDFRIERLEVSISQPWMRMPRGPSSAVKSSASAALRSLSSGFTSMSECPMKRWYEIWLTNDGMGSWDYGESSVLILIWKIAFNPQQQN